MTNEPTTDAPHLVKASMGPPCQAHEDPYLPTPVWARRLLAAGYDLKRDLEGYPWL